MRSLLLALAAFLALTLSCPSSSQAPTIVEPRDVRCSGITSGCA
jgi:hypothetical protein